MNCHEAKQRLVDLVYDELPPGERTQLEVHLADCPACRSEAKSLREAHSLLNLAAGPNVVGDQIANVAASGRREPPESALPGSSAGSRRPLAGSIDVPRLYQTAASRAERRQKRWRTAALAAAAVAAVVLVAAGLGLRLEFHRTHVTIAWDEPPGNQQAFAPAIKDPSWATLQEHRSRLDRLDELVNLATRDYLQSDTRRAAELAELRRELAAYRQQTSNRINQMQVQSNLRWQVIRHDLDERTAAAAFTDAGANGGE